MTLIEQIKRDMAEGTPGAKWVVGDRGASIYIEGDHDPYAYGDRVGGAVHDYDSGIDLEFSDADLSRICRVPELEAAYIALFEENERLKKAADEMAEAVNAMRCDARGVTRQVNAAFAAYREATQ